MDDDVSMHSFGSWEQPEGSRGYSPSVAAASMHSHNFGPPRRRRAQHAQPETVEEELVENEYGEHQWRANPTMVHLTDEEEVHESYEEEQTEEAEPSN